MKKKIPLLVKIVCVVIVVVFIVILVGSNYMVNYAVTRESNSYDRNVETTTTESESDQSIKQVIRQNEEIAEEIGQNWHDQTPYETVTLTSFDDLQLKGEFYAAKEASDRYAVLVHGYKQSKETMYPYASYYYDKGYNVLVFDHRSHGDSEGKYIGMGWLEKEDVLQWLSYITDRDANAQIVLHGISMGAATVMMTSGEEALPSQVKACVEDCGYTSAWDIFSSELKVRFNLPEFPLLSIASVMTDLKAGYNFKEASALEQVKKSHTPTIFIHGTEDGFVPFNMLQKVYDAAACEKEMFVVEGADHCDAIDVDREKYFENIFAFLDNYVTY